MRAALIYNNGRLAGSIKEVSPSEYVFTYDGDYFKDEHAPAISLTLPKSRQEFTSPSLFPFFFFFLSEGHNRTVQARIHKLDETDDFGILLATAQTDTPGAITIKPL